MSVHINWEPYEEVHRQADVNERWCFSCRARRRFEYVVIAPVDPMSWYGGTPRVECGTCHLTDGDMFPGRYREWEDD